MLLKTSDTHFLKISSYWLVILTIWLGNQSVFGQSMTNPVEQVSFQTPKTLYFSGEKIWFDAKVTIGTEPSASQVVYAELVDRNAVSIIHAKVPLQKGEAVNYLKIPEQTPSDHYLLRVYTRISPYLDINAGISQQFVTVINPRIPPKSSNNSQKAVIQASQQVAKGATVEFPASVGGVAMANASGISIANPFLPEEQHQWKSDEVYTDLVKENLLPELFGHVVKVKVPTADTTLTYFLSVHGVQSALFTDHPDRNGNLVFDIGGLRHWDRLIVQLENGQEMPGLEVISPVIKTTFRKEFDFPELTIQESQLEELSRLLKASMMQTYFLERFENDSLEVVTGFVADYTYNLDDYTRFENVETVLREYVPSVAVRTREKKKEFRLLNEANKTAFEANPLIVVDAMPVFDSDLLASFNPKLLQRLEVLNREFYLNDRTYPGVLSFSSYTNNFGLFPLAPSARFFDYHGLQPFIELDKKQFSSSAANDRFPDWRTVLFWGENENKISVQAPDLAGIFVFWEREIQNGVPSVKRTYFQVKN
ncbi:MAG: hypothetical protein KGZ90_14490 [Algoriphagus sp.]|nr:hypothetical protein [Algoriphagus sp.]